jgi:hypothetical protein
MTQTIPTREPAGTRPAPHLDCERLDCYRVAIEFQTIAARLVSNRRVGALRDQLDRASVSIVLNIAEGAGRRLAREKRTSSRSLAAARPSAPPPWICFWRAASSRRPTTGTDAPSSSEWCRC